MRLARAGNPLPGAVASAVGYESGPLAQPLHRGLPSSLLTFIITLNTPVLTGTSPAQALDSSAASRLDVLTAGLHLRPAYIGPSPGQVGLQVSIDPRASRLVLGLPAAELAGATLDGTDVVGFPVSRLREQLAAFILPACAGEDCAFTAAFIAESLIAWAMEGVAFDALYPIIRKLHWRAIFWTVRSLWGRKRPALLCWYFPAAATCILPGRVNLLP